MITKADLESVCQWASSRHHHECVHGVVIEESYLVNADVGKLRGRHKTETIGVGAIWDGIQEGMSKSMFSQMLEGGASTERRWRDSEGNLHIEKIEGNGGGSV